MTDSVFTPHQIDLDRIVEDAFNECMKDQAFAFCVYRQPSDNQHEIVIDGKAYPITRATALNLVRSIVEQADIR